MLDRYKTGVCFISSGSDNDTTYTQLVDASVQRDTKYSYGIQNGLLTFGMPVILANKEDVIEVSMDIESGELELFGRYKFYVTGICSISSCIHIDTLVYVDASVQRVTKYSYKIQNCLTFGTTVILTNKIYRNFIPLSSCLSN